MNRGSITTTLSSAVTLKAGKIGQCMSFNSPPSAGVTIPGLKLTKSFTVAMWVKATVTTADVTVASLTFGSSVMNFVIGSDGKITVKHGTLPGGVYKQTRDGDFKSKWVHFVYTHSVRDMQGTIYTNGTDSTPVTLTTTTVTNDGVFQLHTGDFNDVRVYDECLPIRAAGYLSLGLCFHQRFNQTGVLAGDSVFYNYTGLTDCSGFKHNGTLKGTVTRSTDTAYGLGSIRPNGVGYIEYPNVALDTSGFTFAFWIKMDDWSAGTQSKVPIFSYAGSVTECYFQSGRLYMNMWDGSKNVQASYPVNTLSDGWHHFVIMWWGENYQLNLDGEYKAEFALTTNLTTTLVIPTTKFLIGYGGNGGYFTGGHITDFRIYNTALYWKYLPNFAEQKSGIDKWGYLYANELVEGGTGFSATGAVKCNNLHIASDTGEGAKIYATTISVEGFFET